MDPTQILLDIRATITNPRASNATAWEDLRDYWSWRRRGGFEASIVVKTGSKNILTVSERADAPIVPDGTGAAGALRDTAHRD